MSSAVVLEAFFAWILPRMIPIPQVICFCRQGPYIDSLYRLYSVVYTEGIRLLYYLVFNINLGFPKSILLLFCLPIVSRIPRSINENHNNNKVFAI